MKVVLWLLLWPILVPFWFLRRLLRCTLTRPTAHRHLVNSSKAPVRWQTKYGLGLTLLLVLFLWRGVATLRGQGDVQRTDQPAAIPLDVGALSEGEAAVAEVAAAREQPVEPSTSVPTLTATSPPTPTATASAVPTLKATRTPIRIPTSTFTPLPAAPPTRTVLTTSIGTDRVVETTPPTATSPPAPTVLPITTVNRSANLRGGPGTEYGVVGGVQPGQPLTVVARTGAGDWYQLADGAWVAAFLVENAPKVDVAQSIPTRPVPTETPVSRVVAPPIPPPAPQPATNCHPSYPTVCIPPAPPDLNCGEIPYRRFQVLSPDPHGFDGDYDGVGCER